MPREARFPQHALTDLAQLRFSEWHVRSLDGLQQLSFQFRGVLFQVNITRSTFAYPCASGVLFLSFSAPLRLCGSIVIFSSFAPFARPLIRVSSVFHPWLTLAQGRVGFVFGLPLHKNRFTEFK